MMKAEVQKEHQWLQKFVGEWNYETQHCVEPGKAPETFRGTESVRSLGGVWIVAEGQGQCPGGGETTTLMTLGYDPQKGHFVSTWICGMMTYLWSCKGTLDASEKVLTLEAEGPSMDGDGTLATYRDTIEFKSDDHRTLTATVLGKDGQWTEMMTAHYYRKK